MTSLNFPRYGNFGRSVPQESGTAKSLVPFFYLRYRKNYEFGIPGTEKTKNSVSGQEFGIRAAHDRCASQKIRHQRQPAHVSFVIQLSYPTSNHWYRLLGARITGTDFFFFALRKHPKFANKFGTTPVSGTAPPEPNWY